MFKYVKTLKNNHAFTLAEVLITLGIIGVVAAITIPGLMTKLKNHQIEAVLKEDYSILNQMMISAYDNGALGVDASKINKIAGITEWFEENFLPYIKVSSVCYDETGCWTQKKYLSGSSTDSSQGCGQNTISFILNNGSAVCIDDHAQSIFLSRFGIETDSATGYCLRIDVNGDKNPNVVGKDVYMACFKEEVGMLVPAGADMTMEQIKTNCSVKSTSSTSGAWCFSLVKNRGWKVVDVDKN